MPPWKPEQPEYGEFVGARRLADEQIDRIVRWVEDGAREGDPAALPPPPASGDGWELGNPDLIIPMREAYTLPTDGPDVFRNFVIPIPTSARQYVKAWEFHPGNAAVVHHATMVIDPTRASRQRDEADPLPGYEGLIPHTAKNPDGYFLGWTPGQTPYVAPDDMAWKLEANSDLVLMLHLRPTGKREEVQASLGLFFSEAPPSRVPAMLRLSRQGIDIPPGDSHYTIFDSYTVPVDVDVYAVQPHAHNLARQVKGFATLPDGTRRWLIFIKEWDFHWQDAYRFVRPVFLPKGTTVAMEYTYDNSAANPRNPNRPPRRVRYGQRTSDEMGELWVQMLPRNPADLPQLTRTIAAKLLPENIVGYEMLLASDPDNVGLHDDLALLYTEAGQRDKATTQFAESLRIKPQSAAATYNLGNALVAEGKIDEASVYFRKALQIDPNYANAHHGLGVVLQSQRRNAEAAQHYLEALRLDPRYADAQYNLALIAASEGDADGAIERLRRAVDLRRDWPAALVALAGLLAMSPGADARRTGEAVSLAERAAVLTDYQDAAVLDMLAAAWAAAGQYERAAAIAEKALVVATASDPARAAQIRARIDLYRQHTAPR